VEAEASGEQLSDISVLHPSPPSKRPQRSMKYIYRNKYYSLYQFHSILVGGLASTSATFWPSFISSCLIVSAILLLISAS
jgi:hypothetical protein